MSQTKEQIYQDFHIKAISAGIPDRVARFGSRLKAIVGLDMGPEFAGMRKTYGGAFNRDLFLMRCARLQAKQQRSEPAPDNDVIPETNGNGNGQAHEMTGPPDLSAVAFGDIIAEMKRRGVTSINLSW